MAASKRVNMCMLPLSPETAVVDKAVGMQPVEKNWPVDKAQGLCRSN